MNLENVETLAKLMDKYGLQRAEVCEGENSISLAKQGPESSILGTGAYLPPTVLQPTGAPAAEAAEADTHATKPGEELKSPLVGVVYLAPEPDAAPFLTEGQTVKKGQVLCIVETMKVMNEFTAPRDGTVSEICVSNGEFVEHGQCLFRLV